MSGEIRKVLMKVEGFLLTTTDAVLRRQRVFSYGWIVMTDSHDILRGRASQHPRESVASVSSVCPVWDFLFPLASRVHISAGGDQLSPSNTQPVISSSEFLQRRPRLSLSPLNVPIGFRSAAVRKSVSQSRSLSEPCRLYRFQEELRT